MQLAILSSGNELYFLDKSQKAKTEYFLIDVLKLDNINTFLEKLTEEIKAVMQSVDFKRRISQNQKMREVLDKMIIGETVGNCSEFPNNCSEFRLVYISLANVNKIVK